MTYGPAIFAGGVVLTWLTSDSTHVETDPEQDKFVYESTFMLVPLTFPAFARLSVPAAEEYNGLAYRSGGLTPSNFTPRQSDVRTEQGTIPGLSTYSSELNLIENGGVQPGSTFQVIDTSKLPGTGLRAYLDDPLDGHVTITTESLEALQQWADTRSSLTPTTPWESASEYARALFDAWVRSGRTPK